MNIDEYIAHIESTIHSFSIVASYNLYIDRKTEDIAFLSGKIEFRDGSLLDFKEFVESKNIGIEKYKYGYNYRVDTDIIFRYDNAPDPHARKLKTYPHHKHIHEEKIIESKETNLRTIIEEIEIMIFSKKK